MLAKALKLQTRGNHPLFPAALAAAAAAHEGAALIAAALVLSVLTWDDHQILTNSLTTQVLAKVGNHGPCLQAAVPAELLQEGSMCWGTCIWR